jgi:hypothetical protein
MKMIKMNMICIANHQVLTRSHTTLPRTMPLEFVWLSLFGFICLIYSIIIHKKGRPHRHEYTDDDDTDDDNDKAEINT